MSTLWNRILDLQTGDGLYEAFVVPTLLPSSQVQSMLPHGLSLATTQHTCENLHPVIFLLGKQQHVRMRYFNLFDLNYLEHLVAIPHTVRTKKSNSDQPFIFHPRLHLNRMKPIWIGSLYGFAKRKARMKMTRKSYEIRESDGTPILNGSFQRAGATRLGQELGSRLDGYHDLFHQGLVLHSRWRGLLFSRLEWSLNEAEITPIRATLEILKPFLPGISVGRIRTPPLRADLPLGAIKMICRWHLLPALKWPYPLTGADPL